MAKKFDIPNLLNFSRSLNFSPALMYSTTSDGVDLPINVNEVTVRGTVSSFSSGEKGLSETLKPNIQRIDTAFLPHDRDWLKISFTLVVTPSSLTPGACNDAAFESALAEFVKTFGDKGGFTQLGVLYAWNIANARWMWRNGYGTDKTVTVKSEVDGQVKTFTFNPHDFSFDSHDSFAGSADGKALGELIAGALSGKTGILRLQVDGKVKLFHGQEVYPSQEFVEKEGSQKEGDRSRTLAALENSQAFIHSQKIGNAIRTIDSWHGNDEYGYIAVEPFGGVTQKSIALRHGTKAPNLYALLATISDVTETIQKSGVTNDSLFVMANMIRGGVFSGESKKAKEEKSKKAEVEA